MKKAYNKPMIEKHIFTMDIHVMSSSDVDHWNAIKADFRYLYAELIAGLEEGSPEYEALWNDYLTTLGGDDATSGWCYFTSVTPS